MSRIGKDDYVINDARSAHVERLDDQTIWMAVYTDGRRHVFTVVGTGDVSLIATEEEDPTRPAPQRKKGRRT